MATGEHVEVELKLYVPHDRFDAVDAAIRATGDVHEVHLHAEYVDTVDWQLSLHGLTWRIRREGERWVQTLKARVDSTGDIERIEHDVDITGIEDRIDHLTMHRGCLGIEVHRAHPTDAGLLEPFNGRIPRR